jgi:RIO-like serine/threonine protein kinase
MSSADVAVRVFLKLEPADYRVLMAIEFGMSKHEFVPERDLPNLAGSTQRQIKFRLSQLNKSKLIKRLGRLIRRLRIKHRRIRLFSHKRSGQV